MKHLFNRKASEIVIYAAAAAALIQSPAAELGRISGAGYNFMIYAAISGIAADIIFAAEFIIKGIRGRGSDGFKIYFLKQRGYIDFINSFVMLIFVSIPLLIIVSLAGSENGALYISLIIYGFSPALRILRILKLSSLLGGNNPGMASRHTAVIADSSVMILFTVAFLSQLPGYGNSVGIILFYLCAIILVLIFRILYRRHFESTVSDIVNVIDLGLRRRNYNLQVKLDDRYGSDEIYRLASYYNTVFLPAKMKQILGERRTGENLQVKHKSRNKE